MTPIALILGAAMLLASTVSSAVTLRVANAGDIQSMDPHSLFEALQIGFGGNIYEPLITRDKQMQLMPVLATRWRQTAPTLWRFDLRRGVTFHDGTPFTADDVVFSFRRVADEGSDLKLAVASIKEVRKIDSHAVEIESFSPNPILPEMLVAVLVMSQKWCKENNAERAVDRRKGIENTASFKANGTGPFRLKERQPGLQTVLVRNGTYWGRIEGNLDEVIFMPIANDSTRVAALLSSEVDVMEPVPMQDVPRVMASSEHTVLQGPELRTLFLGMDQKRDELLFSSVKGRNPFKDVRVRRAVYQAIDIEAIRSRVMRNAATPTALLVVPGVRGFQADLNTRLSHDVDAAKQLLTDAGYPDGFEVGMNCPNDRYVNDAEICQAVAANLARIGIKVNLQTESKTRYFPKLLRRDTSFYLFGWAPASMDSQEVLALLAGTQDDKGWGRANHGGYSNRRVDDLAQRIQSELDEPSRNGMIREAFKILQDEVAYVPLHQQALAWGASKRVQAAQMPDNIMRFMWMSLAPR